MHKYNAVLLDLDGTVIDSAMGVFNGIEYALCAYGIKTDRNSLYKYMGPPIRDTFADFLPNDEVERAVSLFREYYSSRGINECEIYKGVDDLIKELAQQGIKIALATSKPEIYARKILEHFCLDKYFTFIGGAGMDATLCTKTAVIQYVMASKEMQNTLSVMVGDRASDLVAAEECKMDAIGVLYGYGTNAELSACRNVYIANDVQELRRYLIEE